MSLFTLIKWLHSKWATLALSLSLQIYHITRKHFVLNILTDGTFEYAYQKWVSRFSPSNAFRIPSEWKSAIPSNAVVFDTRSCCVYYSTNTKYTPNNSEFRCEEKIHRMKQRKINNWTVKSKKLKSTLREKKKKNEKESVKKWRTYKNLTTNEIINKIVDSKFNGTKEQYTKKCACTHTPDIRSKPKCDINLLRAKSRRKFTELERFEMRCVVRTKTNPTSWTILAGCLLIILVGIFASGRLLIAALFLYFYSSSNHLLILWTWRFNLVAATLANDSKLKFRREKKSL